MSNNTTSKDIKEYRTNSLTDETTNAMLKKVEKRGWKVLSTNWDSKEGCYVIKYQT